MKNNTIKIKAFLCLLLLMCGWVSVQAQQVLTVKGVVVDALKEPLPGASVQVVGMSTGTVTDLDGNFSLQVPKGKTIAVSFYRIRDTGTDCKSESVEPYHSVER